MAEPRPSDPTALLLVRGLNVYYGRSHALQGVDLDARARRALGRRPQRHGQDDALQGDHGARPRLQRIGPHARRGARRPAARGDRAPRHRLCPAGTAAVAVADRRRAPAHDRGGPERRRVDGRAHLRRLSAPRRAQVQRRRPAFRRRAADAGYRPGARDQSAAAHHGRADRGPRAGDRRPGRGDAGPARDGKRHRHPRHRAEHRRRDIGFRPCRDHGQRAHQSHRRSRAGSPRTATCSSACSGSDATPRPPPSRSRGAAGRERAGAPPRPSRAAPSRIYVSNPVTADPLVAAGSRTRGSRPSAQIARRRRSARSEETPPSAGAALVAPPGPPTVLVAGTLDTKGPELRFIRDLIAGGGLRDAARRRLDQRQARRPAT